MDHYEPYPSDGGGRRRRRRRRVASKGGKAAKWCKSGDKADEGSTGEVRNERAGIGMDVHSVVCFYGVGIRFCWGGAYEFMPPPPSPLFRQ